ncbi:hypothetical protein [Comamonas sp.]|uniref:hypothetical protein n=1 Tax=Comamonas sp. TaxID=34028 RepID=UPI0028A06F5F|nr:hypothetical protein [Comamonas sp.]
MDESTYALSLGWGKCRSNRFGKHTPMLKQARGHLCQHGLKAGVGGMAKRVRVARLCASGPTCTKHLPSPQHVVGTRCEVYRNVFSAERDKSGDAARLFKNKSC